jgi:phenylpropionate dioxygenase-like ring-hydroxylating dioxygenase large terminal subunit
VIVRDRGGTVRALSSVCQHRAMLVAEGAGNTRGFVCPYHHWTYDLDGRLVGAPRWTAPATSTRSHSLPELKVEIWQGFIFVNSDLNAPPLAPNLASLSAYLDNFRSPRRNWRRRSLASSPGTGR